MRKKILELIYCRDQKLRKLKSDAKKLAELIESGKTKNFERQDWINYLNALSRDQLH